MKRFVLIGLLALTGCGEKPMTNEAIAASVKYCTDHGLAAREYHGWFLAIVNIQCEQHVYH